MGDGRLRTLEVELDLSDNGIERRSTRPLVVGYAALVTLSSSLVVGKILMSIPFTLMTFCASAISRFC